ncbi:MAG: hypothetical protein K8R45_05830 [Desulfobacterales bacterium]|nr:hypothetical protein [Desulfobacterales bacterium]
MPDKKPIRILRIIARLNVGGPAIQAISLSSELSPDRYQTMLVCGQVSAGEGDMAMYISSLFQYVKNICLYSNRKADRQVYGPDYHHHPVANRE